MTPDKYRMRAHEFLIEMRPDSEEFERLDYADQWLAKYTYENLDKWPDRNTLDVLTARYPIKKPRVIYRGMNFRSKEKWDEFMAEVSDGTYDFGGVSSWGSKSDAVEQFAVTRPSYYLDHETMKAHGEAQKEREYISGYRGVILKMTVQPGQGIDVNASRLGHEDEIILLPGAYEIEVERVLKRYRDAIDDGDVTIDDIVTRGGAGAYDRGFRDYVLHHHRDRLGDGARTALFKERRAKASEHGLTNINPHVIPPRSHDPEGTPTKAILQTTYSYFEAGMQGEYTPAHDAICRKEAATVVRKMIRYIRDHPDYVFEYAANMRALARYAGLEDDYSDVMKRHIGAQYQALQVAGREFNHRSWKDDWERRAVIKHHGEHAGMILNQIRESQLMEGPVEVLDIGDMEIKVFDNPSRDQVWNFTMETIRKRGALRLRGLSIMDGTPRILLWDAWLATHGDILHHLFGGGHRGITHFDIEASGLDTLYLGDHYADDNPLAERAAEIAQEAIAYRNSQP